jgi:hypothetical protein
MRNPALRAWCFALCIIGLATLPPIPTVHSQSSPDVSVSATAAETGIPLVPAPGRYGEDITIRNPVGTELELRFLHADGTPHTDFFLPVDRGIHLDGPSESEIHYRIEIRGTAGDDAPAVVSYFLDTLSPLSPILQPRPGVYSQELNVRPAAVRSEENDRFSGAGERSFEDTSRIFYRLLDRSGAGFQEMPPDGVLLTGAPGTITEYRVAAYAIDSVGNRSDISVTPYRIDRVNEVPPSDRIVVSPVDGDFANEQLLFLDTRGLRDVEIRLFRSTAGGGEEPVSLPPGDFLPMVVPGEGSFRLRLTATAVLDGATVRREVRWSQLQAAGDPPVIQGYLPEAIELSTPTSRTRYTLDDTGVTGEAPIWIEPLTVTPTPDALRFLVLRYRLPGASRETRITLLPDGRRAPPPERVVLDEGLLVYALADTEIEWRPEDGEFRPVVGDGQPAESGPSLSPEGAIISWQELRGLTQMRLRSRYPGGVWTERLVSVPAGIPPRESPRELSFVGTSLEIEAASGPMTLADLHDGAPILRYRSDVPFRWNVPPGFRTEVALTSGESLDAAFSGDQPDGTGSVLVDTAPPAPPVVAINADRLQLSGEGSLIYRIDGGPDTPYEAPVSLPGVDQALRRYQIEAYRIVDGLLSPVRRVRHTVDRRVPFVPPIEHAGRTVDAETILANDAEFDLSFANPFPDLDVHYEVSTAGRPAVPGPDSPSTSTGITLETAPGENVSYALALRGRFAGSRTWSRVQRYTVVIDRVPPEPPRIEEARLSTDRMLVLGPPPERDVTIWYRLSPDQPFRRYLSPVELDDPVRSGPLHIEAYTRDLAGNQTFLPEVISLSDPAEGPPVPRLTLNGRPVFDPRVVIDREVLVDLRQERDHLLMWRIVPDTGDPPSFEAYAGEVLLSRGTYTVEAYSRAADDRRSDLLRVVLSITDEPMEPPERPFISYNPDGRSGDALWSGRQSRQLFVSVSSRDGAEEGFMPQDGVFRWVIPEGETRIAISFFTVDESGRRSPTEIVTVEARPSARPPRISGAEDGGRYGESRRIELIADGEIRYTLSTDGSPPATVHALSPRYEAPLDLAATPGEERIYRLRFRTFSGERALSEEDDATIIIDRRPPSPPILRDIEDGGYYSTAQSFRLTSAAGDRIMYRLVKVAAPEAGTSGAASGAASFLVYAGETIPLPASELERVEYSIEAYTVDSAGNRSQGLSRWRATIDTASIHVAAPIATTTPGRGSPGPDGSRDAPFDNLDAALRESIATGRSSLFLTRGEYPYAPALLAEALSQTGGLTIVGGLDPLDWARRDEWSHLRPVDGGQLLLTGRTALHGVRSSRPIRIAEPTGDTGAPPPPEVVLERLVSTSDATEGITLESGSLHLAESVVTGRISADSGTNLRIDDSNTGQLSARNATVAVRGGTMAGMRLHDGATATVTEGRIEGAGRAGLDGLVYVEDSNLTLSRSIVMDTGTDVVLIRGRGGHVRAEGTSFSARGEMSAVGLRLSGGSLALAETIILVSSPNYAYGLALRDASVRAEGSAISLLTETEAVGIVAGNSSIHLDGSILRLDVATPDRSSRGEAALTAVSATGASPRSLTAVDNSVISTSGGTAFAVGPDLAVRIDGNLFVNWDALLQRSSGAGMWNTDGRVERADELNVGSRGRGNRTGELQGTHPDVSTIRTPRPGNLPPPLAALRESIGFGIDE